MPARPAQPATKTAKASAARHPPGAGEVLSRRALNRALLARQLLLRRATLPAIEAIEHLVGLQAQAPYASYVGLWSRLAGFRHEELASLLLERRAVRIALMRSTVHLVSARDCLTLRPVIQPMLTRSLFTSTPFGRRLAGMDLEALVAAGRALLEERPRTPTELGVLLRERWPDRDAAALANALRNLAPLVQVPPRGIWGVGGQTLCTTAEAWLGQPLAIDTTPDGMIVRYLAAFGLASVADIQVWSGLTQLQSSVERLRPQLRTFRDEDGRELFDLPEAPRPDPDTLAPPRFLPEYDNALLSHADRTRIIADEHRPRVFTRGAVLLDGFVCGAWKVARQRTRITLRIEPFMWLSGEGRATLEDEGTRLLSFVAGEAEQRAIQFALISGDA